MNSEFLSSAVHDLRFSAAEVKDDAAVSHKKRISSDFSIREWSCNIGVLDRVGLTLPLYARMLKNGDYTHLHPQAIAALDQRRRDNEQRMSGMLLTFKQATIALQQAGVRFACVKGFSLIPEYLEELWQRHQIDFDLLVTPGDELRAQQALEKLGYKLTAVAGDDERRLCIPMTRPIAHNAYLYNPQEGAAIELHSRFWEAGAEDFPLDCPCDAIEKATIHTLGSLSFPRLSRHHAFLYQILHVFRHFLGSWARLLWLYELAAFMHRYRNDDALWRKVQALLCTDTRLAEAAALVLLSVQNLFNCPIPPALESICTLPADSLVRLWIGRYAQRWLLTDMPGNKLNLLLHRHFFSDNHIWRRYLAGRLAPFGKRPILCERIEQNAAKSIAYRMANLRFQAARIVHHLSTDAGFAVACIDWKLHLRSNHDVFPANDLRRGES
ncbi:MAG: nucleotidyltransferase family protein [Terracidiphilus sp.]|jgi:hypothetical protein